MSDGIYINGRRPKSKKEIKDALATNPASVSIECTSIMGGFEGSVAYLPEGKEITFAGPCPHTKRNFYGTISRKGDKVTVK